MAESLPRVPLPTRGDATTHLVPIPSDEVFFRGELVTSAT